MTYTSARIDATAIVSPDAELADSVEVGPQVIIEGKVKIGANCVLRPGALLCGPLTMGQGNTVFSGAVLGDKPQHLKYQDEPTTLEIGDFNVFREHVTVHRGTVQAMVTRIGNHNVFMAHSHVGHDCVVGDRCVLVEGALVGGHCILGDNVYLSSNSAVHQFCRVGRLGLLGDCSITTKDIPPFIIQQHVDTVIGVNVVGMRRAALSEEQIAAVQQAFRLLFRAGLPVPAAVTRLEAELGRIDVVQEMIAFLSEGGRGINRMRNQARLTPL